MRNIEQHTAETGQFTPSWVILCMVSAACLARLDASAMLYSYREQHQWREQAQVRRWSLVI
jgi:hypothetical protein